MPVLFNNTPPPKDDVICGKKIGRRGRETEMRKRIEISMEPRKCRIEVKGVKSLVMKVPIVKKIPIGR